MLAESTVLYSARVRVIHLRTVQGCSRRRCEGARSEACEGGVDSLKVSPSLLNPPIPAILVTRVRVFDG